MAHRLITTVFTLALLLAVAAGPAGGTMQVIGNADYAGGNYNLIYDNDSPFGSIVYLDYSKSVDTWDNQVSWSKSLNDAEVITYNYNTGISVTWSGDWRLPSTVDGLDVYGDDGTTTAGHNITTSEMGHLYYTELGNLGYYDTSGSGPQPGWGLTNTGDFSHLVNYRYWSGTEYASAPQYAWNFSTFGGSQGTGSKGSSFFALAVRPANVASAPVPEPATMLLLGSGLIGLAGYGRKKFFKK